MSDSGPAIELERVHKRYRVYQERYRSLKEIVVHRRFGEWEDRWALTDVSLAINHGETFGLVGPNGAGKSTALKLMAKILEPDEGSVRVNGRISGLLELAAGFQPEYTGRENVYLNASLLGLKRRAIDERFDRIVDFAELADHIDAPVRTYSSGMLMRLGFSVAIHVEPDIMVVDEILAVGDEAFQLKCYEWLERFQSQGGTVVLVSHNLGQVRNVCTRAAWIMEGSAQFIGPADECVDRYLQHVREGGVSEGRLKVVAGDAGAKRAAVELGQVILKGADGNPVTEIRSGEPLTVDITFRVNRRVERPTFGVAIHRSDDVYVYGTNTEVDQFAVGPIARDGMIRIRYPHADLMSGVYRVTVAISDAADRSGHPIDSHWKRHQFRVTSGSGEEGVVRMEHEWELPRMRSDAKDAAERTPG
jgi:ABC-type polysaccharide/polyol phosphate transport system ATPase subunit